MKFPKIFHLTVAYISWIEVFDKAEGGEGPLGMLWQDTGESGDIARLTPV